MFRCSNCEVLSERYHEVDWRFLHVDLSLQSQGWTQLTCCGSNFILLFEVSTNWWWWLQYCHVLSTFGLVRCFYVHLCVCHVSDYTYVYLNHKFKKDNGYCRWIYTHNYTYEYTYAAHTYIYIILVYIYLYIGIYIYLNISKYIYIHVGLYTMVPSSVTLPPMG